MRTYVYYNAELDELVVSRIKRLTLKMHLELRAYFRVDSITTQSLPSFIFEYIGEL